MKIFFKYYIFTSLILLIFSKTKEEWKTRAIYQIMTDRFARKVDDNITGCNFTQYCGGHHVGLKNHLDYIKNMGFDAIWISPIVKNTEGSYHAYHTLDFYDINEHFGTKEELKDLIKTCHENGIWIMLDVVANHVAPVGFDFRSINPFNSPEYYHDSCVITDWANQKMVENCRLLDLPDLKHENDFVTDELLRWINWIIKEYDIDGIRVDTVPEVPKWFWKKFQNASGVYQIGEVFNGNVTYVAGYQECLDATFNYPLSFTIKDAFGSHEGEEHSMLDLKNYWTYSRGTYLDPKVLGVFIDNHDNTRYLNDTRKSKESLENASVFTIFFEGIPVLYYGDEQYFTGGVDPYNREPLWWSNYNEESPLYIKFALSNKIRKGKKIWETELENFECDEDFCSFTRNDILVAVTRGKECERSVTQHKFEKGDKICNIFNTEECVEVTEDPIKLKMDKYPKVFVKMQDLKLLN